MTRLHRIIELYEELKDLAGQLEPHERFAVIELIRRFPCQAKRPAAAVLPPPTNGVQHDLSVHATPPEFTLQSEEFANVRSNVPDLNLNMVDKETFKSFERDMLPAHKLEVMIIDRGCYDFGVGPITVMLGNQDWSMEFQSRALAYRGLLTLVLSGGRGCKPELLVECCYIGKHAKNYPYNEFELNAANQILKRLKYDVLHRWSPGIRKRRGSGWEFAAPIKYCVVGLVGPMHVRSGVVPFYRCR